MKSIIEISQILSARVEQVCEILLPGGKEHGGMWIAGDVTGGEGKSLQVHLQGDHQGKWRDWAESELRGDLIDLWMQSKGITARQALSEIRDFLGIQSPFPSMRDKTFEKPKTDHKPLNPTGKVYEWFSQQRNIEGPTVSRFDIKVHTRGNNGSSEGFIVFPCYSPSGEWINSSYRGLLPDEHGKKKVFQDKGCAPCLFGWQAVSEEAYRKREIVLCEGQVDAMTWNQWGIPALSIPNGSGTTWIDYEWENLEVFEVIYLSFDMDGKTSAAMHKAISRLGVHRCMIVKLPHKDANECLQKGSTAEDAKRWLSDAKPPVVPNFVSLTDLEDRLVNEFFPKPTDGKPLLVELFKQKREEDCFFIRPGEVSVWTGVSSHGKTTFLTYLFVQLSYLGEKAFICSLEMKPEKISKKMILSIYKDTPIGIDDIRGFTKALGENTCFCDRVGYIGQKELLEMMEYAHKRYGVTQFLVDSLMRIEGLEEEYAEQGKFMNLLAEFSKRFMVHVHLVAHPRKTADDAKPTANDLKGSSLLRNNADNILVVSRNTAKERKLDEGEITEEAAAAEHDTHVIVEKDREEGKIKSFKYKYVWKHHYFQLMQKSHKATTSWNGESEQPHNIYGNRSGNSSPPKKMRSR